MHVFLCRRGQNERNKDTKKEKKKEKHQSRSDVPLQFRHDQNDILTLQKVVEINMLLFQGQDQIMVEYFDSKILLSTNSVNICVKNIHF